MSELKGIFFNNGMQGIGTVKVEGDFFVIDQMLQIVIVKHDNGSSSITFQHILPFVDQSVAGVDIKVHVSSAFLYELDEEIKNGYYTSTRRVQPVSSIVLG